MKIKGKIWDKERHWFSLKFSFVFLALGLIFSGLTILEMALWGYHPIPGFIFSFCSLVCYSIFFAPFFPF